MSGHRFFVPSTQIDGEKAIILGDEAHHLKHVLRLGIGAEVTIFDGNGTEFDARVEKIDRQAVDLRIIAPLTNRVESPLTLTLVQGLVKGEKFDWVVQKAVELGVSRLQPLISEYTDVQLNEARAHNRITRWQRIALEATKQSGRRQLMTILPPLSWRLFLQQASLPTIFFAEHGGDSLSYCQEKYPSLPLSSLTLVVGSEGGWSAEELQAAAAAGFFLITLGPRILRAETAAITAISLLQYLYGDLASVMGFLEK